MKNRNSSKTKRSELATERRQSKSDVPNSPFEEHARKQTLHDSIERLHGPEAVGYEVDELIVLCLVRNGRPYVRSFVEHYRDLGVKHLFFLDNGSTDGTVEALRNYENVTVLRTRLPFKEYQMSMKRYLFERFGRERWSLYVDIDELFDYPYSDIVSLRSLLGYLNQGSYTAVVAQMLDMFPEKPLSDTTTPVEDETLKGVRFYDTSNVRARSYWDYPLICGSGNALANDDIKVLRGGVQATLFGERLPVPLTKHPLVFLNGRTKPMDGSSHAVSEARVADLTCVLFHYKLLDHLYGQLRRAVQEENYMKDSAKHKRYLEILERTSSLRIRRDTSRRLDNVNELVENGFLVVSEDYASWVDREDRITNVYAPHNETYEQSQAFFEARSAQRAKVLKISQLERRIGELRNNLEGKRRRIRSLTGENRNLKQEMQAIRASAIWKLLKVFKDLRTRMFRKT
jgi:regulator of replication initiation timing